MPGAVCVCVCEGGSEQLSGMGQVRVQVKTFQEEEELTQICRGKKEYSLFRLEQRAQPTGRMLRVGVGTGGSTVGGSTGDETSEAAQGWVRRGLVYHTVEHL